MIEAFIVNYFIKTKSFADAIVTFISQCIEAIKSAYRYRVCEKSRYLFSFYINRLKN